MIPAPIPENESTRLSALRQSGLLDTPKEEEFDEIVRFASILCNTPISLISLVDSDRQWFKARIGLDVDQTNRDVSFCSHAILHDQLFEVYDAILDERFSDNPLVTDDPSIRFYAGVPLVTSSGNRLGTLCVIDKQPGRLTDKQRFGLKVLAHNVIKIAELRIKNKELHYLTETQKKIISILAHDVRNPLASIKNVLTLRQSEVLDAEDATGMMEMVTGQLDHTIEMVDNVVNWGQLHLRFGHLRLADFDIHQMVERIFGSERLNSLEKGNKLVNNIPAGTMIQSDERVLEFVLRNLVSNAGKFTRNGQVSVSLHNNGTKNVISIADTGVGMPAEKVAGLFKGETGSTLGTNKEKGSGLGLLLVKEFVERLDGTIAAESRINEGTVFKIEI